MKNKQLSWEETYKAIACSNEDWSEWERIEDGWKDLELEEMKELSEHELSPKSDPFLF